jgi:hypothetical protein
MDEEIKVGPVIILNRQDDSLEKEMKDIDSK